jgi:hypothetical protein
MALRLKVNVDAVVAVEIDVTVVLPVVILLVEEVVLGSANQMIGPSSVTQVTLSDVIVAVTEPIIVNCPLVEMIG